MDTGQNDPFSDLSGMRRSSLILFLILLLTVTPLWPLRGALAAPGGAPYPPSRVITSVSFNWSSYEQQAPGSDNWAITWAADGHQYTTWGDGGGFGGSDNNGRSSLGIARVEGDWHSYKGYNIWGGKGSLNRAEFEGKSYGILSIAGNFYLWVSPGSSENNYTEARLAKSSNRGANWTKADWSFTETDRLVLPTFLQFGKDYTGARDKYVYVYATRLQDNSDLKVQKPGQIDLLRVPKDRLLKREAYEFFAGLNRNGEPRWTRNLAGRRPVFEDPNGVGWNVSVTYNAGLKRYLLATEHGQSAEGNLGLFDAPQPWGPWTTVGYYDNWGGYGDIFFWNFSNKWTSSNGRDFTLIFTGINEFDSWNTVRGSFNRTQNKMTFWPSIQDPQK